MLISNITHKPLTLREYQRKIIDAIIKAYKQGFRSICVVSPTGSGKTVMFSHIARDAADHNKSALIVSHRSEIHGQIMKKVYDNGIVAGQITANSRMTRNPIQCGMIQTICRRLNLIPGKDLLIIDEGHHGGASTYKITTSNLRQKNPAMLTLYFTATPIIAGRGMGDICDCMVVGDGVDTLVSEGWLSYPLTLAPVRDYGLDFHVVGGDYSAAEQFEKLQDRVIVGDTIAEYRKHLDGRPTICFIPRIDYGYFIEKVFNTAGIKAKLIQGGEKYREERDRACKMFGDGSISILISCDIVNEGFDVPEAVGAIFLRKTRSFAMYSQQGGRVLRPVYSTGYAPPTREERLAAIAAGPKPFAIILDQVGNCLEHGHLTQKIEWRLDITEKEIRERKLTITRCPVCRGQWPGKPRVCPGVINGVPCLHEFQFGKKRGKADLPEHVEGTLREFKPLGDDQGLAYDLAAFSKLPGRQMTAEIIASQQKEIPIEQARAINDILKGHKWEQSHIRWALDVVANREN